MAEAMSSGLSASILSPITDHQIGKHMRALKYPGLVSVAAVALLGTSIVTGCEVPEDASDDKKTGVVEESKDGKKKQAGSKKGLFAGDWKIMGNPKPTKEQYTNSYAMKFQAKNTAGSGRVALISVGVVKGEKLLGSLECIGTGNEVAAGETTTLDCVSTDGFKRGWTKLTFEDGGF